MAKGKFQEWLTPDGLIKIQGWARDGLIKEQIAQNMGIGRQTLYEWETKYKDIADAVKKGKEVVDREVENALYKSALGYDYEEITKEPLYNSVTGDPIIDENGKHLIAITKIVRKHILPSNTAQIYWLKCRKPAEWREKKEQGDQKDTEDLKPLAELLGKDNDKNANN